jgi:hypothetical protein
VKARSKKHRAGAARGEPATVGPADTVDEARGPRQVIEQAARDIERGLRDTDLHGTPSNVPGPGPAPERSPGAEVPPAGIDTDK